MSKTFLPISMDDLHLTAKQMKFVGIYCSNGFNEIDAAKQSGLIPSDCSQAKARNYCLQLLGNASINTAVNRMIESTLAPYRDRMINQMVQQLQIRANYDISWFFDTHGYPIPLEDIPPERRVAIDRVESQHYGKDADVRVVKYILADRDAARKELKALLEPKEGQKKQESGMRAEIDEIFAIAQKGADFAKYLEGKHKKDLKEEIPAAEEQQTTILSSNEILKRLKDA